MAGVIVFTVLTMIGIAIGAAIAGSEIATPVVGTLVLGLYAAALGGIGIAVGGVFGTSYAGLFVAIFTIVTWFIGIIGPALNLPDILHEPRSRPTTGSRCSADGTGSASLPRSSWRSAASCSEPGASDGETCGPRTRNALSLQRQGSARYRPAGGPLRHRDCLISAGLHVAWNVRIKTAGDPLRAATVGMIAATVGIVPLGIAAWSLAGRPALPIEGIALGVVSGAVEAVYFILLSAAYRRGDLSVVYPIARGTAPLLAVAVGVALLGERLGVTGSIGVALLLIGFLVLQRPWQAIRDRGLDPSVAFALATGVSIAAYSAIDRVGARLIDPLTYAAILWVTAAALLVTWVRVVAGGGLFRGGREQIRNAAIGGWLTLAAYLLILWAFSVAPLSGVAPLRESAAVFAAAWGSVRLGEAVDRGDTARRIGASVLIVAGAVLLAVAG